jgi:predicted DNA-binding transcriptional regulator AlpA
MKTDRKEVEVKEPLWTSEDLADFLVVRVPTLYQWNYKGTGPRYISVGRYVRYREEDVQAWLDLRDNGAHPSLNSGAAEKKARRCRSVGPGAPTSTGSADESTRGVSS